MLYEIVLSIIKKTNNQSKGKKMKKINSEYIFTQLVLTFITIGFLASILIPPQILHKENHNQRLLNRLVVIDLFNDKEVKVEGWMYDPDISVGDFAQEWCLNHSIPEEDQPAKITELVNAYNFTISDIKIKLKQAPAENTAVLE